MLRHVGPLVFYQLLLSAADDRSIKERLAAVRGYLLGLRLLSMGKGRRERKISLISENKKSNQGNILLAGILLCYRLWLRD